MFKAKPFPSIFIVIVSLALAAGCNPDAFIKHLNPSSREFVVSEDGDSINVRFENKDWYIYDVVVNGKSLGWLARGEGTPQGKDGRVKVSTERFTMYYKHSSNDELTVYFRPNFSFEKIDVEMIVSTHFEQESIHFTQNAGSDYKLEKMTWGTPTKGDLELERGWWKILDVKNNSQDTVSIKMRPFMGAARQVTFSEESGFASWRADFKVPIPDATLDDNKLTFNKETNVTYSYAQVGYPVNDQTVVKVKVPPLGESTRDYGVLWDIESYTVDYIMSLRNMDNGHIIDIKGRFISKSPVRYTIFYEQK